MRILFLIALLCNTVFSALYLTGAKYTQIVTINHLSVGEASGHFLFQKKIPRTGLVALNVDSANDVGITRINDTTRIPRWIIFTTDTLFLYADIAVSSTVDTSYRIQYGKALNETNSSATFTNNSISHAWMADIVGSTIEDYAGGVTLTNASGATITSAGCFSGAFLNTTNAGNSVVAGNVISGLTKFHLTAIGKWNNINNVEMFFDVQNSTTIVSRINTNGGVLFFYIGSQAAYYTIGSTIRNNVCTLIDFIYDGTQAVNTNRVRVYVNGVQMSLTFGGTIPTSVSTLTTNVYSGIGTPYTTNIVGSADNFILRKGSFASTGYITTQNNSLSSPSTFSTLGTVTSAIRSGSRSNNLGPSLKLW